MGLVPTKCTKDLGLLLPRVCSREDDQRCRLCTTNDLDALREEIAREMWEGRAGLTAWVDCGPYWREKMLDLADDALRAMMREHPVEHRPGYEPGTFRGPPERDG